MREWTTRATAPSLDDPRFEALLLRLHASIDIHEFWSALLSILDEFVPHDACVAYLDYVDFASTWDASRILATPNARRLARVAAATSRGEHDAGVRAVESAASSCTDSPKSCPIRTGCANRSSSGATWRRKAGTTRRPRCSGTRDRLASEIVIRRTAEQGDFTAREMALLAAPASSSANNIATFVGRRAARVRRPAQRCRRRRRRRTTRSRRCRASSRLQSANWCSSCASDSATRRSPRGSTRACARSRRSSRRSTRSAACAAAAGCWR